MKTIITLTMNPAIDKSANVAQVIVERKLYCHSPRFEPGGGGVNVSRAIRKLGGESMALFPCGGPTGEYLLDLLKQEGLDCRSIPVGGWTRENLVVLEESSGLQFRFGMPGSPISESEWRNCLDAVTGSNLKPDYIVASGSLPTGVPEDFYAQVARIGKDLGARVIIDTSGNSLRLALQEGVYLIKPNIRELGELVGKELVDETSQREIALEMVRSGQCAVAALSLGAGGVLLATADGCLRLQTPLVPIKSKVGAGDSMVAGIVLSLARGNDVHDAVRFGVAAGAAAVMTPGSELCRREDAERLYGQMIKELFPVE
ncbi:MAG: phosphofructokinase [Geobacteraceae bacterium GWC2_55_20]|nr:MAG: phosphofructokinase [Geobacteraceae bacterium GWC2_55_20]OGU19238.1 MAG: phosphofructokinase [Geobacteraceae bacterium GWF2_54_21]HBA71616.1 phosphofructokinase [Geobacter sp.]HCE67111.1 phosphofructokinase [Geobacter sp.]